MDLERERAVLFVRYSTTYQFPKTLKHPNEDAAEQRLQEVLHVHKGLVQRGRRAELFNLLSNRANGPSTPSADPDDKKHRRESGL